MRAFFSGSAVAVLALAGCGGSEFTQVAAGMGGAATSAGGTASGGSPAGTGGSNAGANGGAEAGGNGAGGEGAAGSGVGGSGAGATGTGGSGAGGSGTGATGGGGGAGKGGASGTSGKGGAAGATGGAAGKAGGSTAGGNGGTTAGGGNGGAAAGGAPATSCPLNEPIDGNPCSGALTCTYGDDLRLSCRTSAQCVASQWQVSSPGCSDLPSAGKNGCPQNPTATGMVCTDSGKICNEHNGAMCICGCFGPTCTSPLDNWECVVAPAAPCPPYAPNLGQPCTLMAGQSCTYGVCGTETSTQRACDGGVWIQLIAPTCPQ